MYALLLLAAVAEAAAVMVRVYDSCHVTSVKRGDLEGVGGIQQKLDAFYCIFELFRPLLAASLGRLAYERYCFCVRQRQDTLDHLLKPIHNVMKALVELNSRKTM